MPDPVFTALFLVFFAAGLVVHVWLAFRQISSVMRHRKSVPLAFEGAVSLSAHQKAADYTAARSRFGLVELAVSSALLILMTLAGGLDLVVQWTARLAPAGSVLHATLIFLALGAIGLLIELPLDYWRTFRLEAAFGFNRSTRRLFFADVARNIGLSVVLVLPLAALVVWLMQSAGQLWWFCAWLTAFSYLVLIQWLYPNVIAPWFNSFLPLGNAQLRVRIDALFKRCGFASDGIFVMDGSKRSAHGNAYFTGLSRNKRIVFFDTLLDRLDFDQIEAVLAHELGHFKHRHILKRLIAIAVFSLLGFWLLGWLANQSWFYLQLGVTPLINGSNAALALVLFVWILPVFMFPLSPLTAMLSRRQEFEADAFAVQTTGAVPLKSALVKLFEDNAATLTPDPLHSAFYDSHPPAPIRIARLEQLQGHSA